jgi:hypothetical protein
MTCRILHITYYILALFQNLLLTHTALSTLLQPTGCADYQLHQPYTSVRDMAPDEHHLSAALSLFICSHHWGSTQMYSPHRPCLTLAFFASSHFHFLYGTNLFLKLLLFVSLFIVCYEVKDMSYSYNSA